MNGNRNPQMGKGLSASDLINTYGEDIFDDSIPYADEEQNQYGEDGYADEEIDQGPEWENYDYGEDEHVDEIDYAHEQIEESHKSSLHYMFWQLKESWNCQISGRDGSGFTTTKENEARSLQTRELPVH